jgi:conjugal transfer/type IV secretion protein DotA/TraY
MLAEFGITKGGIIRHAILPGIIPRVKNLLGTGFDNLAYLMALAFNSARILPNSHPYLLPANVGTYGIRHVLAQTANHLKLDWKHADQIVVFLAMLSAIVILFMQFILMAFAAFISTSRAAMPSDYSGFFKTPNPKEDIAFRLLDLVFGIPNIFGSKEMEHGPTAAQLALQSLFEFYSFGLLLVGFLIIIYFVITIVAETAQSGSPFGTRFNSAWAPIRLVVFFALLLPVTSGMNGGQLIALAAAKYGSGLATNGWLKFNEVIAGKYLGEKDNLVGVPETPEMASLLGFMLIAKTCQYSELRNSDTVGDSMLTSAGRKIKGYIIVGSGMEGAMPLSSSYADVAEKTGGGDLHIRFGNQDQESNENWSGFVNPHCGEIVIRTSDISEPGSAKMQEGYLRLVQEMWEGAYDLDTYGENFNLVYSTQEPKDPSAPLPPSNYKIEKTTDLEKKVEQLIKDAVKAQIDEGEWDPEKNMEKVGWAGAGIWYNKIAQQNGALITAVANIPQPTMMPRVMEYIRQERIKQNRASKSEEMYSPVVAGGPAIPYEFPSDNDIGLVLNHVYKYTTDQNYKSDVLAGQGKLTGNLIIDTVNLLFGTRGLYDMCKDTKIHPLAQLSSMGKNLIESSVKAMGFSIFSGVLAGVSQIMSLHLETAGFAAASFFMTVASTGLLLGFILFYIIPFMPFMYFFFGVGSWIKGIFEAMVGLPLWALAHLRIDGEGLPGQAASAGYFLIFEIFIRPILMVFGLLGSIVIFAASVKVLNDIFYLVIANLSGHDPVSNSACFAPPAGSEAAAAGESAPVDVASMFRGPIDEFFFTVMYAIMVYMIGMSCFKMIDKVPDNILRWMNDGVSTFGDKDVDPAEGLVSKVAIAGSMAGQLKDGLGGIAGAFIK